MTATSPRFALIAAGVALSALLASGTALAGQDAAKRYFQNGVDLITAAQPNYQDAYYQFQLAYAESSKSWKVLGNLGLCAMKLERDQEAVSYYELYLEKGGAEIAQEERDAIEQDLLLLKGNVASVRFSSSVKELKLVDRRAGSQAPAQSYSLHDGTLELQLRAGNHTITASSAGRELTWEVVVEPKTELTHHFDFDAPVTPPKEPTAAAQPAALEPGKSAEKAANLRVPAYVTLAAGAAVVGVGGYFAWQVSDYDTQADEVFACDASVLRCSEAQRAQVRQLESDSSDARTRAFVAFGVGGAALVTGTVLLLFSGPPSGEHPRSATIAPFLGYGSAGVLGSF